MNLFYSQKTAVVCIFSFLSMILTNSTTAQQLKPIAQAVQNAKSHKNFTALKPFFTVSERQVDTLKKFASYLKQETVVRMNDATLQRLYDNSTGAVLLTIPFKNRQIEMELVEQKNLWEGFQVKTSDSNDQAVPYEKGKFYRGIIKGDNESVVAISVFENEMMGIISSETDGNVVLSKVNSIDSDNAYVMYAESDMLIHNDMDCKTDDFSAANAPAMLQTRNSHAELVSKWVRIYLECDFGLYQKKDSSVTKTVNYMVGAFNNVAALFMNENISVAVSEVFVWTSPSTYSRSSASSALSQFRTNRPHINGDLGQLVNYGGAGGGVAYVNTLCKPILKYSYAGISDTYADFNTYSWTVMVMSHELGHNLGSYHTQWCGWQGGAIDNCYTPEGSCAAGPAPVNGGTIMSYCHITSYGIKFINGFGQQPGDLMRNIVAKASCLGTSPDCTLPSLPDYKNITMSSVDISWQDVPNALGYQIEYKKIYDDKWTLLTTSVPTITLSDLPVLDSFLVRLSTICQNGTSAFTPITGFRTLNNLTCSDEQTPSVSVITQTSARIHWADIHGATSYLFEYRVAQSEVWKKELLPNPSIALNNLVSGVIYDVRITATCSDVIGQSSPEVSFVTSSSSVNTKILTPILPSVTYARENDVEIVSPQSCIIYQAPLVESMDLMNTVIRWTHLNEANYYIVQYKLENSTMWSTTIATANTHTFTDLLHKRNYQVRILPVCNKIKGTPSPIISFTVEPKELLSFDDNMVSKYKIYPNPTQGILKLQINSEKQSEVLITFLDATGRILKMPSVVPVNAGVQTVEIDLMDWNNGIYFVRLAQQDKIVMKKFIVMRP